MIDKKHIGKTFPPLKVEIEKGRLRFFAKATGQTDPVYSDEAAAKKAGYRSLPVPPTFLFCMEMEVPDAYAWLPELNIDLGKVLHGEQSFKYHKPAVAGDTLTFETRIADIYDKKNGALDFVIRETRVSNQDGEHVADLKSVLVQRNQP